LTFAFSHVFYSAAFHLADLTGGDDGLRGIPKLALGLFGYQVSLASPLAFYYFALAWVALAVAGLKRVLDSPFGAVLVAIRENSDRASACGYDVNRVKLVSFVLSALITDRKSTRLNSSHVATSYAVFCLKKNRKKS